MSLRLSGKRLVERAMAELAETSGAWVRGFWTRRRLAC